MVEPFDETRIAEYLIAFTDGELDAEHLVALAAYIETHPRSLEILRDQRKLRDAARRVTIENTPPTPKALRNRVEQMGSPGKPTAIPFAAGPRRWATVSAAAIILLVSGAGVGYLLRTSSLATPNAKVDSQSAVPPVLISAVTKVHVDCSRFSPQVHSGPFPTTAPFSGLAEQVEREFHSKVPYPDLSSIGYSFVGAGPCREPLENTVHLLYRSVKPTIHDTLSIFVQPYTGQVKISPGDMTLVANENSPHPMYVWRTDNVVYFLVTDEMKTAEQARDAIQVAFNH